MAQTVIIPTPLRRFTNGIETIEVEALTIGAIFEELDEKYPGIHEETL
jgi:molybdopterin converting factor small subunit